MVHIAINFLNRIVACFALLLLAGCSDTEPTVVELEKQLAGKHCRYDHEGDTCKIRGFSIVEWLVREPHHCDWAAVACLSEIRTERSYIALINVLSTKTDVETCDGTFSIRSKAVKALGESGYKPAIQPLKILHASNPVMKLSSGASGCKARPEPTGVLEMAITDLGG